MYVCVCARALPPQIDSSATCAQLQLPTDGGGIRERETAGVTGRGREKERREWERWREMKDREEGRGENKVLVGEKGKSGRSRGG